MLIKIKVHAILTLTTGKCHGNFGDAHGLADKVPGYAGIMTVGMAMQGDRLAEILKPLEAKAMAAVPGYYKTPNNPKDWEKLAKSIENTTVEVNWPQELNLGRELNRTEILENEDYVRNNPN